MCLAGSRWCSAARSRKCQLFQSLTTATRNFVCVCWVCLEGTRIAFRPTSSSRSQNRANMFRRNVQSPTLAFSRKILHATPVILTYFAASFCCISVDSHSLEIEANIVYISTDPDVSHCVFPTALRLLTYYMRPINISIVAA